MTDKQRAAAKEAQRAYYREYMREYRKRFPEKTREQRERYWAKKAAQMVEQLEEVERDDNED